MTRFLAPWPHVSVIAVLDILLVAVNIYEFLIFIVVTTRNGIDKVLKVWDITSAPQKRCWKNRKHIYN